jgi:hypothetical protein
MRAGLNFALSIKFCLRMSFSYFLVRTRKWGCRSCTRKASFLRLAIIFLMKTIRAREDERLTAMAYDHPSSGLLCYGLVRD